MKCLSLIKDDVIPRSNSSGRKIVKLTESHIEYYILTFLESRSVQV